MRRILGVLAVAAAIVVAIVVLTGGGGGGSDDRQVRATLAGFTQASAQKDYKAICARYLAPHLIDLLQQIKLPCRSALARGLKGVKAPTLTVKSVKVTGATALAAVHSTAANQAPLDGTIELIKVAGAWKIRSLPDQGAQTTP